ncbi:hypothetical protein LB517_27890 [Mesorhizobium sp. BR1-1-12]|uniref:hypothetical protein n=1 Tax=Mesorhizobium sp. BR1-1-12 TaxID=2876657 RepID=UPI001CD17B2C|nr:hypothetical protein [Mesorhizobium sp. BR1-1-12]MBZ9973455.1 hypothetical protein [Mesorhizobium sp. BR1-1-12]
MSKTVIKAADIRAGMAARFCAPEWAIMWEVSNSTGGYSKRYADAVMMSLWPSRGLELHGIEIKVSRSDWKREALDPTKAELIAQYCDRWWVHTSPGVVDDISALPPAWGLREFDGSRWTTKREAEKTEAVPMSRGFLAAMLRRADETMRRDVKEASDRALETERKVIDERVQREVAGRTRSHKELLAVVTEFEKASGIKLEGWVGVDHAAEIGRLAKAIADSGFTSRFYGVLSALDTIDRSAATLRAALGAIAGNDNAEPQANAA